MLPKKWFKMEGVGGRGDGGDRRNWKIAVILKHKFLMLQNSFFDQFCFILFSVASLKKTNIKNAAVF